MLKLSFCVQARDICKDIGSPDRYPDVRHPDVRPVSTELSRVRSDLSDV